MEQTAWARVQTRHCRLPRCSMLLTKPPHPHAVRPVRCRPVCVWSRSRTCTIHVHGTAGPGASRPYCTQRRRGRRARACMHVRTYVHHIVHGLCAMYGYAHAGSLAPSMCVLSEHVCVFEWPCCLVPVVRGRTLGGWKGVGVGSWWTHKPGREVMPRSVFPHAPHTGAGHSRLPCLDSMEAWRRDCYGIRHKPA